MNKKQKAARHLRIWHVAAWTIAVGLAILVLVLGFKLNETSSDLGYERTKNQSLAAELSSYERTLCKKDERVVSKTEPRHTLVVEGVERTYRVHKPSNYDESVRYPVILSFDGIEGSGGRMQQYSGLDNVPAIVVYADSLKGKAAYTAWQGAPYSVDGERDIMFVEQILNTLPSQYCVDETKIFAVGMSNGGLFATIVGCELGNKIKAVATVSGAFYSTCQNEQKTPSLLLLHSTADRQVPILGRSSVLPKVSHWAELQATARHCEENNVTADDIAQYYDWKGCDDNSRVRLVTVQGQAHGWLQLSHKSRIPSTTAGYIWDFFETVLNS